MQNCEEIVSDGRRRGHLLSKIADFVRRRTLMRGHSLATSDKSRQSV